MRHLLRLSLLFFVAVLVQSCTDEESNRSAGHVQFTFDPAQATNGRVSAADFPAGSYLIITIEDNAGKEVLKRKTINLIKVGDDFISDPIPLPSGSYKLTDFWVASPDRVMLYAAPKAQSPLAEYVDQPLPISFTVAVDALQEEAVQVLDASESSPEDFGYVSFDLEVIRKFALSVFIPSTNGLILTTADAFILTKDLDTLKVQALEAKTNTIFWEADRTDSLQLVVMKDGFSRYTRTFTFNQLKDELNGSPLKIVLNAALTFVANIPDWAQGDFEFAFSTNTSYDPLTIHWGDGTSDFISAHHEYHHVHRYHQPGKYFVDVTGNLDAITELGFYYDNGRISAIDLRHVINLKAFGAGYMGVSPATIDFTHNTKLENVSLGYLPDLEQIIFPAGLKLHAADIGGPNKLSAQDVDVIIDMVYQAAIQHNIRDGYLNFMDVITNEMTGPPSPSSIEKARVLRDEYAWFVLPQF